MSMLLMDGKTCIRNNEPRNHRSHVLKSRENVFKPKCNKELKKKLKKYKLRKNGQEDPDIINVSQILSTSLRIKSPNNQNTCSNNKSEVQENRPYNYLTKMVRLKKAKPALKDVSQSIEMVRLKKAKPALKDVSQSIEIEDTSLPITPKDDQDKKQMNAFKLLMDSRNKSIGCNSPGKEKREEECSVDEQKEKKEIKAKRVLSLNKMAEAKGSLKKVEIEEYREEVIKRKMDDRAKRLKHMIVDADTKNEKKAKIKPPKGKLEKNIGDSTKKEVNNDKNTFDDKVPIIKSFDLFKDINSIKTETILKKISKEDEDFLKKLSPSIRKKENMLCYFQKLSKDSETLEDDFENNLTDGIIKVKLTPKTKFKKKKNILVVDNQTATVNCESNIDAFSSNGSDCIDIKYIRKRNTNLQEESKKEAIINDKIDVSIKYNDIRPKRNTKRPVKYTEDFQLSSSDEELRIFTPRKKRKERHDAPGTFNISNGSNSEVVEQKQSTSNNKLEQTKTKELKKRHTKKKTVYKGKESSKEKTKPHTLPKKASKLAPIFMCKPQLDAAALEAKQKFLHSGVPSQLKKTSIQQTNINLMAADEFQLVVHVQNLSNSTTSKINNVIDYFDKTDDDDDMLNSLGEVKFENLLDKTIFEDSSMPKLQRSIDLILKDIKISYPKFPVYRTYHLLKGKSKGEFKDCVYPELDNSMEIFNNYVDVNNVNPDKLNWSNKYKPSSEKQVIGNFESIKELKKWLVTWTENNDKLKRNTGNETDSSDFYHSESDSREAMRNINNLLIITGKVGTGKTMSVYAVAAELAIKVIEVNASTKRTGKIMLQDLQEATQSHKVDRGKSSTDSSQKSQEKITSNNKLNVMKKRGRKKKVTNSNINVKPIKKSIEAIGSQENSRTGMSLILIDDADIVFDQDDGFCSAISQLIQTSKRPVILVTSSLTCPHLQKFIHQAKIIKMRPFLPRMLGTWLDIMCLADSSMCSPGLGSKTLDLFRGDIRKTINHLQFYMTSYKLLSTLNGPDLKQGEDDPKVNVDDENSCMTWMDNEGWGDVNNVAVNSHDITSKSFVKKHLQLLQPSSLLNNVNVWWNLPDLLSYSSTRDHKTADGISDSDTPKEIRNLDTIAGMLNTISITDFLDKSSINNEFNTISSPWYSSESPSVIDTENLANYHKSEGSMKNIAFELVTKGISEAQRVLESEKKTDINFPSMAMHRECERVVSRHKTLTSYLNPSAALDRRALALDYWPSCRSICRIEKAKTDNNSKRNNRFCHYLKSLNVLCKNDYFDNLSESLSSNCKQ